MAGPSRHEPRVRDLVARSWRRSAAQGAARATGDRLPMLLDAGTLTLARAASPVAGLMPVVHTLLDSGARAAGAAFAVTDATGTLLWLGGDRQSLRGLERIHFVEGADWSERSVGTNAPGTALATGRPVQVIGAEHYHEAVRTWSCVAAPVRDPDGGRIAATIDITGHDDLRSPLALTLAATTAHTLESELRHGWVIRDARTRARFRQLHGRANPALALLSPAGRVLCAPDGCGLGERVRLPTDDPGQRIVMDRRRMLLEPFGDEGYRMLHLLDTGLTGPGSEDDRAVDAAAPELRVLGADRSVLATDAGDVRLSLRHSELLVLLVDAPRGLTAHELAVELCEDERSSVAVRAEVARLRARIGPDLLSSHPYCLARPLRTDAEVVRNAVAHGDAARALQWYAGPMLPHSVAPGVVARRRELDQLVRGAVVGSGDPALLRRWVEDPAGRDDATAWHALTVALPPHSPQRAAAAQRAHGLDLELGR